MEIMYIHNKIVFEWDEVKAASNHKKHGITFTAIYEFDWHNAAIWADERSDYGEERRFAIGYLETRLYVVVYTKREAVTRIISLRKANDREKKLYEKKITNQ